MKGWIRDSLAVDLCELRYFINLEPNPKCSPLLKPIPESIFNFLMHLSSVDITALTGMLWCGLFYDPVRIFRRGVLQNTEAALPYVREPQLTVRICFVFLFPSAFSDSPLYWQPSWHTENFMPREKNLCTYEKLLIMLQLFPPRCLRGSLSLSFAQSLLSLRKPISTTEMRHSDNLYESPEEMNVKNNYQKRVSQWIQR